MSFPLRPVWALTDEVRQVVDPADIAKDVVHYNIPALEATGEPTLEPAADIKSGKLLLRGDEVLISRLNPRKSRVVRTRREAHPILASTEFVALRPVDCEPRFLTYCLLSETTRQLLDSEVRSVTRSHQRVDPQSVTRLAIPAPATEVQQRIADFLDDQVVRLDRAIELRPASHSTLRGKGVVHLAGSGCRSRRIRRTTATRVHGTLRRTFRQRVHECRLLRDRRTSSPTRQHRLRRIPG
jgi:type I restriction enzyme S subunit